MFPKEAFFLTEQTQFRRSALFLAVDGVGSFGICTTIPRILCAPQRIRDGCAGGALRGLSVAKSGDTARKSACATSGEWFAAKAHWALCARCARKKGRRLKKQTRKVSESVGFVRVGLSARVPEFEPSTAGAGFFATRRWGLGKSLEMRGGQVVPPAAISW